MIRDFSPHLSGGVVFFPGHGRVRSLIGKAPDCGSGSCGFESHRTPHLFWKEKVMLDYLIATLLGMGILILAPFALLALAFAIAGLLMAFLAVREAFQKSKKRRSTAQI